MKKYMYLRLFHGRKPKNRKLEDWGSDGPVFGPLRWAHTTYACEIKIAYEGDQDTRCELRIDDDMVKFENVWYGDWSCFYATPAEAAREAGTGGVRGVNWDAS